MWGVGGRGGGGGGGGVFLTSFVCPNRQSCCETFGQRCFRDSEILSYVTEFFKPASPPLSVDEDENELRNQFKWLSSRCLGRLRERRKGCELQSLTQMCHPKLSNNRFWRSKRFAQTNWFRNQATSREQKRTWTDKGKTKDERQNSGPQSNNNQVGRFVSSELQNAPSEMRIKSTNG